MNELPSSTDQVSDCENKPTHVTLVARVDLKWASLKHPGFLVKMISSNTRSLGQK